MTLENLIQKLDPYTIIRVVGVHTLYYGSVGDYNNIIQAKRYVSAIFHYPSELLITISFDAEE